MLVAQQAVRVGGPKFDSWLSTGHSDLRFYVLFFSLFRHVLG
jgi:hypothetical protein